jgi:hypothetical protein
LGCGGKGSEDAETDKEDAGEHGLS